MPDIARALVTVAGADDAMGQAWNVPNAPDRTLREILELFAGHYGVDPKVRPLPRFMLSVAGLFDGNAREMKEMLYQWERPFQVDSSKFARRFWADATSFEAGVAVTAPSYT